MATGPVLRSQQSDVSARKTYDLIDEPVGADYDALLDCALTQCSTVVLTVPAGEEDPEARAVLDDLAPQLLVASDSPRGSVRRYALTRDTVAIMKRAARGLYAWRSPALPQDVSLLRPDGSPWLVSIATERLGYLELAPFEKLLLGRAAPGLAAVLAYQAARDAILAYFERRIESHVDALTIEAEQYANSVVDEGRDELVEALAGWMESGEEARVHVALEVAGALRLTELRGDVLALHRTTELPDEPDAYRSNVVLRERWRVRRRRLIERTLQRLSEEPVETRA
jgi:hypothetical protein